MSARDELVEKLPIRVREGDPKIPRFLAVDFFCGAGGTTRGLIDAGGYIIAGLDRHESCRYTYVANNGNETGDRGYPKFLALDLFPATVEYPGGQQETAIECLDPLIDTHRERFPDVPLLFAICAPCQPFTKLSKAKLSQDRVNTRLRDRSLLAHACKFVERYRPDIILSENVSGITDKRYGGVWEQFCSRLRSLGLTVATERICTSYFGIPQFRKRSILGAIQFHRDHVFFSFELPRTDPSGEDANRCRGLCGSSPARGG